MNLNNLLTWKYTYTLPCRFTFHKIDPPDESSEAGQIFIKCLDVQGVTAAQYQSAFSLPNKEAQKKKKRKASKPDSNAGGANEQ